MMLSDSNPCARDVSSWPPTTIDGREARMPVEVAVAPAAMESVGLQAMLTVLLFVQSLFHLLQFVLHAGITAATLGLRAFTLSTGPRRHFHVIDHNCHCICSTLANLRPDRNIHAAAYTEVAAVRGGTQARRIQVNQLP